MILLANSIVPTVPLMPVAALLGLSLVLQVLFLGLCLWVLTAQRGPAATVFPVIPSREA